jgi:hypothetical protein
MQIHPSFRIVALAEPPVVGSSSQQWLNAEQLTMFLYHHMRSMSVAEELHILEQLVSFLEFASPCCCIISLPWLLNIKGVGSRIFVEGCSVLKVCILIFVLWLSCKHHNIVQNHFSLEYCIIYIKRNSSSVIFSEVCGCMVHQLKPSFLACDLHTWVYAGPHILLKQGDIETFQLMNSFMLWSKWNIEVVIYLANMRIQSVSPSKLMLLLHQNQLV